MLLFSTAQGMVKKVSGSEFQVAKRTILATKLQEEDSLVDVRVVNENKHVVLQTKNGYFLRFPATEVPIKKKAAVGVRGIRLQKKDELEKVYPVSYTHLDVYKRQLMLLLQLMHWQQETVSD